MKKIFRMTQLISIVLLLSTLNVFSAELLLDRGITGKDLGLVMYPDYATRKSAVKDYYYLPKSVEIAKKNGVPQFSFILYTSETKGSGVGGLSDADSGGRLNFLVNMKVSNSAIQKAEMLLSDKFPNARLVGPATYKDGLFTMILQNKDKDGYRVNIVGTGKAPVMSGDKAAVSIDLGPKEAELLWQNFGKATSGISVHFEMTASGLRDPSEATIKIHWDKIAKNTTISAGMAGTVKNVVTGIDLMLIKQELKDSSSIEVEMKGATGQQLDKAFDKAYSMVVKKLFELDEAATSALSEQPDLYKSFDKAKTQLDDAESKANKHNDDVKKNNETASIEKYQRYFSPRKKRFTNRDNDTSFMSYKPQNDFYLRNATLTNRNYGAKYLGYKSQNAVYLGKTVVIKNEQNIRVRYYQVATNPEESNTCEQKLDDISKQLDECHNASNSTEKTNTEKAREIFDRAQDKFSKKDYEQAIVLFKEVIIYMPNFPDLLFNIGASYEKLRKYNKAIMYYRKYIKAFNVNSEDRKGAKARIKALKEHLKKKEKSKERIKIKQIHDKAVEKYNNKEYSAAINIWLTLYTKWPNELAFVYNIGRAYTLLAAITKEVSDYKKAIHYFNIVIVESGNPKNVENAKSQILAIESDILIIESKSSTGTIQSVDLVNNSPLAEPGRPKTSDDSINTGPVVNEPSKGNNKPKNNDKPKGNDKAKAKKPTKDLLNLKKAPNFSVMAAYSSKKVVMKGTQTISFRRWMPGTQIIRFDESIQVTAAMRNNKKHFDTINLNQIWQKQREVVVSLSNQDSADFNKFVDHVIVKFRKIHGNGEVSPGEVKIDKSSFEETGNNQVGFVYGNRGDTDRQKWLDYEYQVKWSLFGGREWRSEWKKSNDHSVLVSAPHKYAEITIEADPDVFAERNVRSAEVTFRYSLFGVDSTERISLKTRSGVLIKTIEYAHLPNDTSYNYSISWHIRNVGQIKQGPFKSTSVTIYADELP